MTKTGDPLSLSRCCGAEVYTRPTSWGIGEFGTYRREDYFCSECEQLCRIEEDPQIMYLQNRLNQLRARRGDEK